MNLGTFLNVFWLKITWLNNVFKYVATGVLQLSKDQRWFTGSYWSLKQNGAIEEANKEFIVSAKLEH